MSKGNYLKELENELTWLAGKFGGEPKKTTLDTQDFLNQMMIANYRVESDDPFIYHLSDEEVLEKAQGSIAAIHRRRTKIRKDLIGKLATVLGELFYVVGKDRSVLIPLSMQKYEILTQEGKKIEIPKEGFESIDNPVVSTFFRSVGLIFTCDFVNALGADRVREVQNQGKQKIRSMLKDAKRSKNEEKVSKLLKARDEGSKRQFIFGGGHGLNNERTSDFLLNMAIKIIYVTLEKYLDIYKRSTGQDYVVDIVLPMNSDTDYPDDKNAYDIFNKKSSKHENRIKATSKIITCQFLYFLGVKNSIGGVFSVENITKAIKKDSLLQLPIKSEDVINLGFLNILSVIERDVTKVIKMYLANEEGEIFWDNDYLPWMKK